tara:strand:+ start:66 stop:266 length:201 start_codon:yes stop_codon:yes gene_type:complete
MSPVAERIELSCPLRIARFSPYVAVVRITAKLALRMEITLPTFPQLVRDTAQMVTRYVEILKIKFS